MYTRVCNRVCNRVLISRPNALPPNISALHVMLTATGRRGTLPSLHHVALCHIGFFGPSFRLTDMRFL